MSVPFSFGKKRARPPNGSGGAARDWSRDIVPLVGPPIALVDPVSYAIENSARLINEFEACSIEIGDAFNGKTSQLRIK